MDFIEARNKRREILAILRLQQSEDAECVNQIKTIATNGKRQLLTTLAKWLMSVSPTSPITTSLATTFKAVSKRVTIDEWSECRRRQSALAWNLQVAESELKAAEAAYDSAAPLGRLSTAFAEDSKKLAQNLLRTARDKARTKRNELHQELSRAERTLQEKCELFLRDGQEAISLEAMSLDPTLGPLVRPILNETEYKAEAAWRTHSAKAVESTDRMEKAASLLRAFYGDSPARPRTVTVTRKGD